MVAFSPLVEKWGLVLPSRNAPHSGWPFEAHPLGSRASANRSAIPIGVLGQPSACAIGRGTANSSGVRMNGLASAGAIGGWPPAARALLRTAPHAEAAGDQMTGCGAGDPSGHPFTSICSACPDDTLFTTMPVQPPATLAS